MELTRDIYDRLKDSISLANSNEDYEFECVFSNKHTINKEIFNNMIMYLQQHNTYQLEESTDKDSLDISLLNTYYRVSINGKANKDDYCNTNVLSQFDLIEKKKTAVDNISMSEYDIYFKMKNEVSIDPSADFMESFQYSSKFFRSKRRYSFVHESKLFRIDLTVVKSSKNEAKTVKDSKLLSALDTYEVEIEYLNKNVDSKNEKVEDTIQMFFNVIETLKKIIDDTDNVMTKSQKELTICSYLSLVNPKVFDECNNDKMEFIRKVVMKKPKSYFLSYQPVTLEQTNLLESELGKLSIQEGYSVTEKADGERMLLYVNNQNDVYLIDSRLNVRMTGTKHSVPNTLLDGEYIRKSKFNKVMKQFMIFDVYFMNKKDVRNEKLVPIRTTKMEEFSKLHTSNKLKVKAKTYHYGDDIFKLSKKVYNPDKYDYHIDGLIYTPTELGVGVYYKGQDADKNTFGSTWINVMKWKPPEENSIDMLTTYGNDIFVKDVGRCKLCSLQTAYKTNTDELIDPIKVLTHKDIYNKSGYVPKMFVEVYIPINDDDKKPRTKLGEYIYNDTIVEYIYDNTKPEKLSWIPYRVRHDKTELYQTSKNILNTANTYTTAMNVWRSIQNPVTLDMITGIKKLKRSDVIENNVYYARNVNRSKILSKQMLSFHNIGIKSKLYELFKNKKYNLLEIACGKAGDLNKWIDNRYTFVLGIDIKLDNIMNSYDGAYKRYHQSLINSENKLKALFLQKDIVKPWIETDEIEHGTLKELYDIAWGNVKQSAISSTSLIKFNNVMKNKFDVVSCQFAIHYMFESHEKLDVFCSNLDKIMKVGSYFMGTCLNGKLVNEFFAKTPNGRKTGSINDNVVWMLKREYEEYQEKDTGNKISVYLESINRVYDEYLVDFDLLIEKLSKYDIEPLRQEDLKELHLNSSIDTFDKWYNDTDFPMNPVLKEYSFLNSWFVFKKYK